MLFLKMTIHKFYILIGQKIISHPPTQYSCLYTNERKKERKKEIKKRVEWEFLQLRSVKDMRGEQGKGNKNIRGQMQYKKLIHKNTTTLPCV